MLGAVSWCVSLCAVSVCFCSFLRREGKIITLIYSKLQNKCKIYLCTLNTLCTFELWKQHTQLQERFTTKKVN